jgi:hypothetical protein
MLCISWQKWADLLVDFGEELYSPWTVLHGSLLCDTVGSSYGPFSVYWNALMFKLFGDSLMTLALFNIVTIIVLAWLIYDFFAFTTDRITGVTLSSVFLGMFAFSQYIKVGNYNFVCPYRHELTHGFIISFLAIFIFSKYFRKKNTPLLFLAGLAAGLVFLTKTEVFAALFFAISFGLAFVVFEKKNKIKNGLKIFSVFLAGFVIPIVLFTFFFYRSLFRDRAIGGVSAIVPKVLFTTLVASNPFYRSVLGTDSLAANLLKTFEVAGWYLILICLFIFIAYFASRFTIKKRNLIFYATFLAAVCLLIPYLVYHFPWFEIFRGLPVAMPALAGYLFVSLRCSRDNREQTEKILPLLMLTIFSAVLLLKIILNVHIFHYGFVLALPATLLFIMFFMHHLPLVVERQFREGSLIKALSILLVGIMLGFHMSYAKQLYDLKTFPIGSGPDTILTYDPKISMEGPCVRAVLEKLKKILKPDEFFAVAPEGVMLYWLVRQNKIFPCWRFLPLDLNPSGEERIQKSLSEDKPDYILLIDRDVSEFGYQCFGKDYGQKIFAWIENNYSPIDVIGQAPFTGKGFGVMICKRNAA